ncbi:hypothetical protein DIPPA_08339 [Diplonema papillatum]|nr:hypothetical protein DIPPA_08339 [Diplonema papillatum]
MADPECFPSFAFAWCPPWRTFYVVPGAAHPAGDEPESAGAAAADEGERPGSRTAGSNGGTAEERKAHPVEGKPEGLDDDKTLDSLTAGSNDGPTKKERTAHPAEGKPEGLDDDKTLDSLTAGSNDGPTEKERTAHPAEGKPEGTDEDKTLDSLPASPNNGPPEERKAHPTPPAGAAAPPGGRQAAGVPAVAAHALAPSFAAQPRPVGTGPVDFPGQSARMAAEAAFLAAASAAGRWDAAVHGPQLARFLRQRCSPAVTLPLLRQVLCTEGDPALFPAGYYATPEALRDIREACAEPPTTPALLVTKVLLARHLKRHGAGGVDDLAFLKDLPRDYPAPTEERLQDPGYFHAMCLAAPLLPLDAAQKLLLPVVRLVGGKGASCVAAAAGGGGTREGAAAERQGDSLTAGSSGVTAEERTTQGKPAGTEAAASKSEPGSSSGTAEECKAHPTEGKPAGTEAAVSESERLDPAAAGSSGGTAEERKAHPAEGKPEGAEPAADEDKTLDPLPAASGEEAPPPAAAAVGGGGTAGKRKDNPAAATAGAEAEPAAGGAERKPAVPAGEWKLHDGLATVLAAAGKVALPEEAGLSEGCLAALAEFALSSGGDSSPSTRRAAMELVLAGYQQTPHVFQDSETRRGVLLRASESPAYADLSVAVINHLHRVNLVECLHPLAPFTAGLSALFAGGPAFDAWRDAAAGLGALSSAAKALASVARADREAAEGRGSPFFGRAITHRTAGLGGRRAASQNGGDDDRAAAARAAAAFLGRAAGDDRVSAVPDGSSPALTSSQRHVFACLAEAAEHLRALSTDESVSQTIRHATQPFQLLVWSRLSDASCTYFPAARAAVAALPPSGAAAGIPPEHLVRGLLFAAKRFDEESPHVANDCLSCLTAFVRHARDRRADLPPVVPIAREVLAAFVWPAVEALGGGASADDGAKPAPDEPQQQPQQQQKKKKKKKAKKPEKGADGGDAKDADRDAGDAAPPAAGGAEAEKAAEDEQSWTVLRAGLAVLAELAEGADAARPEEPAPEFDGPRASAFLSSALAECPAPVEALVRVLTLERPDDGMSVFLSLLSLAAEDVDRHGSTPVESQANTPPQPGGQVMIPGRKAHPPPSSGKQPQHDGEAGQPSLLLSSRWHAALTPRVVDDLLLRCFEGEGSAASGGSAASALAGASSLVWRAFAAADGPAWLPRDSLAAPACLQYLQPPAAACDPAQQTQLAARVPGIALLFAACQRAGAAAVADEPVARGDTAPVPRALARFCLPERCGPSTTDPEVLVFSGLFASAPALECPPPAARWGVVDRLAAAAPAGVVSLVSSLVSAGSLPLPGADAECPSRLLAHAVALVFPDGCLPKQMSAPWAHALHLAHSFLQSDATRVPAARDEAFDPVAERYQAVLGSLPALLSAKPKAFPGGLTPAGVKTSVLLILAEAVAARGPAPAVMVQTIEPTDAPAKKSVLDFPPDSTKPAPLAADPAPDLKFFKKLAAQLHPASPQADAYAVGLLAVALCAPAGVPGKAADTMASALTDYLSGTPAAGDKRTELGVLGSIVALCLGSRNAFLSFLNHPRTEAVLVPKLRGLCVFGTGGGEREGLPSEGFSTFLERFDEEKRVERELREKKEEDMRQKQWEEMKKRELEEEEARKKREVEEEKVKVKEREQAKLEAEIKAKLEKERLAIEKEEKRKKDLEREQIRLARQEEKAKDAQEEAARKEKDRARAEREKALSIETTALKELIDAGIPIGAARSAMSVCRTQDVDIVLEYFLQHDLNPPSSSILRSDQPAGQSDQAQTLTISGSGVVKVQQQPSAHAAHPSQSAPDITNTILATSVQPMSSRAKDPEVELDEDEDEEYQPFWSYNVDLSKNISDLLDPDQQADEVDSDDDPLDPATALHARAATGYKQQFESRLEALEAKHPKRTLRRAMPPWHRKLVSLLDLLDYDHNTILKFFDVKYFLRKDLGIKGWTHLGFPNPRGFVAEAARLRLVKMKGAPGYEYVVLTKLGKRYHEKYWDPCTSVKVRKPAEEKVLEERRVVRKKEQAEARKSALRALLKMREREKGDGEDDDTDDEDNDDGQASNLPDWWVEEEDEEDEAPSRRALTEEEIEAKNVQRLQRQEARLQKLMRLEEQRLTQKKEKRLMRKRGPVVPAAPKVPALTPAENAAKERAQAQERLQKKREAEEQARAKQQQAEQASKRAERRRNQVSEPWLTPDRQIKLFFAVFAVLVGYFIKASLE